MHSSLISGYQKGVFTHVIKKKYPKSLVSKGNAHTTKIANMVLLHLLSPVYRPFDSGIMKLKRLAGEDNLSYYHFKTLNSIRQYRFCYGEFQKVSGNMLL